MLATERETYPNGSTYYSVWMYADRIGSFDEVQGGYKVGFTVHETPGDAIFAVLELFIRRTRQQIRDLENVLDRARSERKTIKKHR
jgi:hypothetical protein